MRTFPWFCRLVGACAALVVFSSAYPESTELTLTVLCTTDIHGAFESANHPAESDFGREPGGGWLRCATVIRELREREPASLLLDAGDMFQGSPAAFLTRGEAAAKAVAFLKYDAVALGNHDLDWGVEQAARLYAIAQAPLLAGNVVHGSGATNLVCSPYLIREVNGIRVAIVGLTSPWIPMWIPANQLAGLGFDTSVQALRRIMPEVRAHNPDVIILLAHQGFRVYGDDPANELNAVASAFPDLDLIIGAHTHQVVPSERIRGVRYTQAGSHGEYIGRALIGIDVESRRVTRLETGLLRVGPEIMPDSAMSASMADIFEKTKNFLAAPVGSGAFGNEFGATNKVGAPMLVGAAIARAVGADIAMHGALSDAALPAGPLTRSHLWRIIPFENTIVLASVTADDVRLIRKDIAKFAGSRQQRWFFGLRSPIQSKDALFIGDGRKFAPNERMLLAVNSFDAASAGGRLPALRAVLEKPESRAVWTGINTRQALEDYIRANTSP